MPDALHDTICAIATPPGEGGIGVVRLSGAQAVEIADRIVALRSGRSLRQMPSHQLTLAELAAPRSVARSNDAVESSARSILDEALVVVMKQPHSFTGEDVVEIQCHGGPVILDQLCRALLAAGARLAEPGEFTKRAFLNGRMDLAQAEAVLETIRAKTARGLSMAQAQRRGLLSREIDAMRTSLLTALSLVEAALDFSDEDITFVQHDELLRMLAEMARRLQRMMHSAQAGRLWREGAAVAILGRPNVGKSSLMNALLRSDRAIVTAIPGTTRDVLEESFNLDGLPVRLFDTAGIRRTDDPVETEGIRRSRLAWSDADLALIVLDGSEPITDGDHELLAAPETARALIVINKCDLPRRVTQDQLHALCPVRAEVVEISATQLTGFEALRAAMRRELSIETLESADSVQVVSLRHTSALMRAQQSIEQATQSLQAGGAGEVIAMDLRAAADALGEITGVITTDDILNRIFSDFCIGK